MSEIFSGSSMLGFCDARRKLPMRHQSLTQLGSGLLDAQATVISGSDATLYFATVGTLSSMMIELDSDYTAVVIPIRWHGEFVINGAQARPTDIYLPQDGVLFQGHGKERATLGITMHRERFIATVAALQGVSPDEVRLDGGGLEVSPAIMTGVRRSLIKLSRHYLESPQRTPPSMCASEQLTRQVTQILIELYLSAQPAKTPAVRTAARLTSIVRAAEERFAEAQARPVSLTDLCAATGVSHVTLSHAFMVVCGCSPMAYFKKRRLTDARLALLRAEPETHLVKSAALEAGITHMGRFSAEYQQLFGELPTTTLNQATH